MPTMFTADPYFETGPSPATRFHGHLHKRPQAFDIQGFERIRLENTTLLIIGEEFILRVFAAERECGLGKVVRPKREKFRYTCHLICSEAGPHHFNHAAVFEIELHSVGFFDFFLHLVHVSLDPFQFRISADLGDHDLRVDFNAFLYAFCCRFEDCLDLHGVDFGIGNAKADPTMPEHRVGLPEGTGP